MTIRQGNDVILFYRNLKDQHTKDADVATYQTEHSFKKSRPVNTTETKDGNVNATGKIEYDFSSTGLYDRDSETLKMLNQAFDKDEMIEVWIVDTLDKDEKDNVFATYVRCKISEHEPTAATGENTELTLTYAVDREHRDGRTPLTEKQKESAQYVFEKLQAKTPEG